MKKIIALLLIISVLLSLSSCGESGPVLKVFNWGEYMDPEVLDMFEEETGIKVIYETYETNESMYTKVANSGSSSSYDIVFPSEYMMAKMIREGLISKINFENVPNASLMLDQFKSEPFNSFDPNNEYFVPYVWGTVGIVYDKTKVTEPVTSWDILWDKDYTQNVFMKDDQRDSIGIALKSLGYSVNSTNEKELEEAKQKLISQRDTVLAYVTDEARDKMINGEAAMAVMYSGDASYVMENNENLAYALPEEGSNVWMDGVCILETSQNKELAEQFINFLSRTDIAQKNIDFIQYNSPHKEVVENYPPEKQNSILFNPDEKYITEKCEVYKDLEDYVSVYSKIWTEVRAY